MEYDLFRNKVQQVKAKKPILFTLETDTPPSIDKIEDFEKIYRMVLPEKYKLFIIEFGGGYVNGKPPTTFSRPHFFEIIVCS